ncbi:MAG: cyclic nucleotide-binding protein, partial [Bryobacterales bacterium]|nr:cyclic nucleotide-binding protein [Bryobacterales bacterium]
MIHDARPRFADQHVRLIVEPVQQQDAGTRNSGELPMVAREKELDKIANAISSGRSVFLVGEAGVGKSRLLSVALGRVAEHAVVARVAAARENVASIFPSLHEWIGLHTSAMREPHSFRLSESPQRNPTVKRVVLGIDDAHLLHPDAAAFLYQLAMFDRASLIMAVRPDVPTTSSVSKLWLDRLAEQVDVKPFTRSAVCEVLSAKLGSYVHGETAKRLHAETAGNALLLRELADHAIAEGSLRQAGVWRWSGRLAYVEGRIVNVVRFRLDDLSPDESELVHIVALAESIEADLPMVAKLAHAAESLNRRGILIGERCDTRLILKLTYPLYSHVVKASMPTLTAFRLRMQLV